MAIVDVIKASPILQSIDSDLEVDDSWVDVATQIGKQLSFPDSLEAWNDQETARVFQYYLPVYQWCQAQITAHKAKGANRPLVIGVSAPQGCGKTTLTETLEGLFKWSGTRMAGISIDDFYLTRAEQQTVADANAGNRLLELRGNAGSHDLELGRSTLEALRALEGGSNATVHLPRYNKSAFQGKGDRATPDAFTPVTGPLDVVLFEGWMSGFKPIGELAATVVDPDLVEVDRRLASYNEQWDSLVDCWIVVQVDDPEWVFQWRLEAEQKMIASGKTGMSEDGIRDFVMRYMPAYKAYLPGLYKDGPAYSVPDKVLTIQVNQSRSPIPR